MEELELTGGGRGWQTARGSLKIWQPGNDILILQVQGYGTEEFAIPCIKALDSITTNSDQVRIFTDFGYLKNYDSQLRLKLTSRLALKRKHVSTVDVLVQSRLVAMGVAVANLALGGLLHSFVDRHAFNVALDSALKEAGVVNFSSRALIAAQ